MYEFVRRALVRSGCEGLGKPDKRLVKRDLRRRRGRPVAFDDPASSSEGIDDGQAGNAPTGLEILRQQGIAPGIERGGDDQ